MIFNFCISIWHAVITRFDGNSDQDVMDKWAFFTFIIIYCVFQVTYFSIVVGNVSMIDSSWRGVKLKHDGCH